MKTTFIDGKCQGTVNECMPLPFHLFGTFFLLKYLSMTVLNIFKSLSQMKAFRKVLIVKLPQLEKVRLGVFSEIQNSFRCHCFSNHHEGYYLFRARSKAADNVERFPKCFRTLENNIYVSDAIIKEESIGSYVLNLEL